MYECGRIYIYSTHIFSKARATSNIMIIIFGYQFCGQLSISFTRCDSAFTKSMPLKYLTTSGTTLLDSCFPQKNNFMRKEIFLEKWLIFQHLCIFEQNQDSVSKDRVDLDLGLVSKQSLLKVLNIVRKISGKMSVEVTNARFFWFNVRSNLAFGKTCTNIMLACRKCGATSTLTSKVPELIPFLSTSTLSIFVTI